MSDPSASALRAALAGSSRPPLPGSRGSARREKRTAKIPSGTLIAKIHGHAAMARIVPPMVGPAAELVATITPESPSARPS